MSTETEIKALSNHGLLNLFIQTDKLTGLGVELRDEILSRMRPDPAVSDSPPDNFLQPDGGGQPIHGKLVERDGGGETFQEELTPDGSSKK